MRSRISALTRSPFQGEGTGDGGSTGHAWCVEDIRSHCHPSMVAADFGLLFAAVVIFAAGLIFVVAIGAMDRVQGSRCPRRGAGSCRCASPITKTDPLVLTKRTHLRDPIRLGNEVSRRTIVTVGARQRLHGLLTSLRAPRRPITLSPAKTLSGAELNSPSARLASPCLTVARLVSTRTALDIPTAAGGGGSVFVSRPGSILASGEAGASRGRSGSH
jgi:hypothetical protein